MKRTFFIISVFLICCFLFPQDKKEDLNKKRNKILSEIEYTTKLLNSTTEERGENIEKVKLIDKRISQRSNLINTYNDEVLVLEQRINDKEQKIGELEIQLKVQKDLYAEFIRFSYKNYDDFSKAFLLLASSNINQFYLRKKYIDQLNEARVSKIDLIRKIKSTIKSELALIVKEKQKKEEVLASLQKEYGLLNSEKSNREKTIKTLANEEKKLREQINEKRRIEKEISNSLEALILEEAKKSTTIKLTPEQKLLSSDFEKNKGRLPWPTRQGVITDRYGVHEHPVIKDLMVDNNGIDITTGSDEIVRSIFDGEVRKVLAIKGANYSVIVKHGLYYSVYNNLYDVKVNVGDKVKTKDIIGKVSKSKGGETSTIHFMLFKGKESLNPEEWISN